MTTGKFSELWVQIGNAAQDIVNACESHKNVSFNVQKRDYVEYEYEKYKRFCKDRHMLSPDSGKIDSMRIDRHKVASCIAGAILSTKPLECKELDDNEYHPRILYLANETLAFFSSLAIIKSFIRSDTENKAGLDTELKESFMQTGFIFPQPTYDDYLPWILYLLQESSIIGFNVLSFSNILYLLETYTFSQLKIAQYNQNNTK